MNAVDSQRREIPSDIALGIDVGGTKIAGVALAKHNGVHILKQYELPAPQGAQALIERIHQIVHKLTEGLDIKNIRSIGIGTPGKVDSDTGVVENIANLKVDKVALGSSIEELTGIPTSVVNDVNAAAIGAAAVLDCAENVDSGALSEAQTDTQQSKTTHNTTVFLNLGTGLAAGVLRDGKLDTGYSGVVGEIGHVPIEKHHWNCACGQSGCLETAGSGGAAVRLWPYDSPAMPAVIRHAHDMNSSRYLEARETLHTIIGAIADTVDIIAVTIDPQNIIIGGGMAKTGDVLLKEIKNELGKRAQNSSFITSLQLDQRLVLAPSDQPIGAVGAALYEK
ncbi:ROK family protein [Alloscardovia criceti]|uniref:ROK family protein n=1 Tax=Alloscardovia criceti TaxID=356828 RepID=UPI000382D131|nr:ROK family protein [Alloscardovia criceti]